jgi:ketosteroid isomerase-like protein
VKSFFNPSDMKSFYRTLICAVIMSFVLTINGCGNPKQEKSINTTFIGDKWAGFSENWENMNAQGCASYYLADGINIAPEFPVNDGREAIMEFYQFLFDMHQSSKYQHITLNIEVLGDSILELGEFSVDWVRNDGSEWNFTARALVHWVENNGDWRIKTLIFNKAPDS